MKVIGPLFLDDLRAEFEGVKTSTKKLEDFHRKIAGLKFLDPACGCGNFLIIAYRELRLLELDILRILLPKRYGDQKMLDIAPEILCNVDQFTGIEIEEFPAQIAQTALWLTDHQMNMMIGEEFGQYFSRLPLKATAKIVNDNALRIDWRDVVRPEALSYILGNPPFIGKKEQNAEQKKDLETVFRNLKGTGLLDFVSGWYIKAVEIMNENKSIKTAFVSTNSITQGEQVGVLWSELLKRHVHIFFAHRTFQWQNEARSNAAVHCVIIGFTLVENANKRLFDYPSLKSNPNELKASNINPYLVDSVNVALSSRTKSISEVHAISYGSMAIDDGHLILSSAEREEFINSNPDNAEYIKQFMEAMNS